MSHQELQEGLNIRPDDLVWIKNGKAHRENGPAVETANGHIRWYIHGKLVWFDQWCEMLSKPEPEIMMYVLKYNIQQ